MIKLKYNGKEHILKEWAKILNVKYTTMKARYRRYKNGVGSYQSLFQAVKEKYAPNKKIYITKDGQTKTIYEWSKILGCDARLLYARYKKDKTTKILQNVKPHKKREYFMNMTGKTYKEWSKILGVSESGIKYRYKELCLKRKELKIDELFTKKFIDKKRFLIKEGNIPLAKYITNKKDYDGFVKMMLGTYSKDKKCLINKEIVDTYIKLRELKRALKIIK